MKKTIIAAMFSFAAILGGNQLYKSQSVSNLSDIMKANVEALALDLYDPNNPIVYYIYPCPELYKSFCRNYYEEYRPQCYKISYCN